MEIDHIEFVDEGHVYKSTIDGMRYQSVTTEIHHNYVPVFNEHFWLCYKVFQEMMENHLFEYYIKNQLQCKKTKAIIQDVTYLENVFNQQDLEFKNYFNYLYQQLKLEWKVENEKANELGTAFHLAREEEDSKTAIVKGNRKEIKAGYTDQYDFDLTKLTYGYRKEFLVYSREALFCGRMDRNWLYRDKSFDVGDWKTNKKLETKNKFQRMINGMEHLDDCNYNHYRLQLSTYAKLFSLWGYKPRYLSLTHVQIDRVTGKEIARTPLEFKYLKEEADYIYERRLETAKLVYSSRQSNFKKA